MTVIKQTGVSSQRHLANLARYLNDERALMRGGRWLANDREWAAEMDATREAYGHNQPGKAGAKTTYMYHQIIGWNPDECSMNGGKMTPEACMAFTREWLERGYPEYEAVFVLHEEKCNADKTCRFAMHIGLNRTNLESGRRLCEGLGEKGKLARAGRMRELDARWGLSQLERGARNSKVHAMQPTRAERELDARGGGTEKQAIKRLVSRRAREIAREAPPGNRMRELARRLEYDGVRMTVDARKRQPVFQMGGGRKYRGYRLGRGFTFSGIAKGLGIEAGRRMDRAMEDGMARER